MLEPLKNGDSSSEALPMKQNIFAKGNDLKQRGLLLKARLARGFELQGNNGRIPKRDGHELFYISASVDAGGEVRGSLVCLLSPALKPSRDFKADSTRWHSSEQNKEKLKSLLQLFFLVSNYKKVLQIFALVFSLFLSCSYVICLSSWS